MKPATALPWKEADLDWRVIEESSVDPLVIADVRAYPEDSAYIVHACNAYPKLVEALRGIAKPALGGKQQQYAAQAILRELGEIE